MKKARITVVLLLGIMLVSGLACGEQPTEPRTTLPYFDSFVLGPFSEDEWESVPCDWRMNHLPYNKYGVYESKFFAIVPGETIHFTVTSDCPLDIHGGDIRNQDAVYVDLLYVVTPDCKGGEFYSHWFKSFELERVGSQWKAQYTVEVDDAGDYQILFANFIDVPSHCQCSYSIIP